MKNVFKKALRYFKGALILLLLFFIVSCTTATKDKSATNDRSLPDPEHPIKDSQEITKFDSTILYTGWYYTVDTGNGYGRQLDKSTKIYFIDRNPILTAKNLAAMEVYESTGDQKYFGLAMTLDEEGTDHWSIATAKSVGKDLAFILDNRLRYVAHVNSQITNGMTALNRSDYSKQELETFKTIIATEN